jgi:energy-coupling factor transporter ATP-binding protein EcfA2
MNLHVLDGPNFSGRTSRLREWVGLPNDSDIEPTCNQNAYIGTDVVSALSGITPSVDAEFELMAADREAVNEARKAMEGLGFGHCLRQNPFTLSGGEQVVTAVLAATAARPKRLAIDCALEQLSAETRTDLLAYLDGLDGDLMVADNRTDEWCHTTTEKMEATPNSPTIHPEVNLKIFQEPCEIELVNLCHYYVKGRLVLNQLNLKFEVGVTYRLSGPNGSGKTTLSKLLTGLIKPTSGEIRVNGKAVQPWRTPGKFVSYHFQNPDFQLFATSVKRQFPKSSGNDNLANWFGLEKLMNVHPLDLPFVLRKRVALATAIGRRAGFLILDEPTLSQDKNSSMNIMRLGTTESSGLVISHSRFFSKLQDMNLAEL